MGKWRRWEHGRLLQQSIKPDINYRFAIVGTGEMTSSFFKGLGEAIKKLGEGGWEICFQDKTGYYWFKREVTRG